LSTTYEPVITITLNSKEREEMDSQLRSGGVAKALCRSAYDEETFILLNHPDFRKLPYEDQQRMFYELNPALGIKSGLRESLADLGELKRVFTDMLRQYVSQ